MTHWALAILVAFSWWTAENGVLEPHRLSGYGTRPGALPSLLGSGWQQHVALRELRRGPALAEFHEWTFNGLLALISLHLLAVAYYRQAGVDVGLKPDLQATQNE